MIKFNEGLNLSKKPKSDFEQLVIKWKPNVRRTTLYGYTWEFPIEAFYDLINGGFHWAIKERVTNSQHPEYGKEFVSITMYHGKDSELEHLINEGHNSFQNKKIGHGDRVKLHQNTTKREMIDPNVVNREFVVWLIQGDKYFIVLENNPDFVLNVERKDIELSETSKFRIELVNELWGNLKTISEGLNLAKFGELNPERWLKGLMLTLTPHTTKLFSDRIYYRKNDLVFLQYDKDTKRLLYSTKIRTTLHDINVDMTYENVSTLIKTTFEETIKLPVMICFEVGMSGMIWWERISDWKKIDKV